MPFCLDEEIRECGMCAIRVRRREDDLSVARELDLAALGTAVGQRDTSDFRRVLRDDRDFRPRFDPADRAMEGDPIRRQERLIRISSGADWLVRRRPHPLPRNILHIAELPGRVAGAVGAPPRDRQILVAAVAPAAVAHHDRVRQATEQCHVRLRRVGFVDLAHGGTLEIRIWQRFVGARRLRLLEHDPTGHALEQ